MTQCMLSSCLVHFVYAKVTKGDLLPVKMLSWFRCFGHEGLPRLQQKQTQNKWMSLTENELKMLVLPERTFWYFFSAGALTLLSQFKNPHRVNVLRFMFYKLFKVTTRNFQFLLIPH